MKTFSLKNLKYLFCFLTLILLFSACCKKTHYKGPITLKIDSTPELTEIITAYSEFLRQDKRLILEDSLVYYDTKIEKIQLLYTSQDIMEIWQARELLVDLVEGLLKQLNANQKILRDLQIPPLTYRDLDITINFESYFGLYVDPYFVGMATLKHGLSTFYAFDMKDPGRVVWHRRPEFYLQTKRQVDTKRKVKSALIQLENVDTKSSLESEIYRPDKKGPIYNADGPNSSNNSANGTSVGQNTSSTR